MSIVIIIQARTGSSRFPNKILMPVLGKTILELMVERVKASQYASQVVVATTTDESDDVIAQWCTKRDITCFRGHPTDLLDRHYITAKACHAHAVVKIPSDCPLIDPAIIDKVLSFYARHAAEYDYVSNLHPASYPDGNDVEVMSLSALRTAWKEARRSFEREHTTPFLWENPGRFRIGNVTWETGYDYSMTHRWTLDYEEDFEFIRTVYKALYKQNPSFGINDILDLLQKNPEIGQINNKYAGVNWYRHHLDELKTVSANNTRFIAP
jgi:spore coat polysaccharide biosynthesis protein SpsF